MFSSFLGPFLRLDTGVVEVCCMASCSLDNPLVDKLTNVHTLASYSDPYKIGKKNASKTQKVAFQVPRSPEVNDSTRWR